MSRLRAPAAFLAQPGPCTTDPREAQRLFDEEAAAIELARHHVAEVERARGLRRFLSWRHP